MADLNKELNEYLLSSKTEKQFKMTIPSMTILNVIIGKLFGRGENDKQEARWIQGIQLDSCSTMTKLQRIVAYITCVSAGIFCFSLSTVYIPVLLLKARKFALLYTLANVFFFLSFCFLLGPLSYLKSLFSAEKRCFSMSYFVTLVGTFYCALHLQSTPLTVVCAGLQLITMISFWISHIPGGAKGLTFFTRMFKSSINSTFPV